MSYDKIIERTKQIKTLHKERLLKLANVVGVGIGFKEINGQWTDQIALIVNVSAKKPMFELSPEDVIPATLEDVVTDVQETGPFKAY